MLTFLEEIFEAVTFIPDYILLAIEEVFNLLMEAVHSLFVFASTLIPLPSTPEVPEFITAINWFFPIGAVIAILAPVVTGYIAFLAIRWIYQKIGEL